MDIFYIIIGLYVTAGIIVHFSSPLKNTVIKGFDYLFLNSLKGKTFIEKTFGILGLVAFLSVLVFTIVLFPLVLAIRFYMKRTTMNNSTSPKEKIKTKQILDPIKNHIIEERDYKIPKEKFIELRKYYYDDNNRLIKIDYYNSANRLFNTQKYFYNSKEQRYAETSIDIELNVEIRTYHLFDSYNRIIATYGELESGHQYCHEFAYDQNGEQQTISMSTLRRDMDLFDIYKSDLKRQEAEFKLKIRNSYSVRNSESWSCSLCGGDETTGCLWHDPTECPR